jgi:putative FmdB family regulatory protein
MPIFDFACKDCGYEFEYLFIRSDDFPVCPKCGGKDFDKRFATPNIRMNSDGILRSVPDPVPPLTELIGKQKKGYEGGYKELEGNERQLKNFKRTKDKFGNTIWEEKRRTYYS